MNDPQAQKVGTLLEQSCLGGNAAPQGVAEGVAYALSGAAQINEEVRRFGYSIALAPDFALSEALQESFAEFGEHWCSLIADDYLPKSFGTRFRRHGRFLFDPSDRSLNLLPHGDYFQSRDVNPVMGGTDRTFAPLERTAVESAFFRALLIFNTAALQLSRDRRWIINAHFIRIPSTQTQAGYPCPEGIHRDGFELISIHLIHRANISGAVTTLYDNQEKPLVETTLTWPLDSIYASDGVVMHYTTPFFSQTPGIENRDTLLLSYEEEP